MATVFRTIGTAGEDERQMTVSGSNPYDIVLASAPGFTLALGDSLEDGVANCSTITAITDQQNFQVVPEPSESAPVNGDAFLNRYYSTLTAADANVNIASAAGDTLTWNLMNDGLISDSPFIGSMNLGTSGTLNITVPASERHGGVAGAGARIQSDGANNTTIFFSVSSTPTTTIEFLEIIGFGDTTTSTNALSLSTLSSGSTLTLSALIIHGWNATSTGSVGGIVTGSATDGTLDIFNCLIYDFTSASSGDGKGIVLNDGSAGTIRILNCTIDAEDEGITGTASTARRISNCAVFATTAFSGGASGWESNSGNNCTDASSAPGSSNQLFQSITLNFFDPPADDYNPRTDGALNDNGADLSGIFTTDGEGTTRSTPWTIGFYHDTTGVVTTGGSSESALGASASPAGGGSGGGGASGLGIGI